MYLECTCGDVTEEKWNELYKGARPINYKWLVNKIKKELPKLYEELALNLFNPWWEESSSTKTHYILVHSAIDYFIRKSDVLQM